MPDTRPNATHHDPRPPEAIGRDLKSNFAELWESVRERAVHTFSRLELSDVRAVKSLEDLRRILRGAYAYDDAQLDAEIDRFVNEGGSAQPADKNV